VSHLAGETLLIRDFHDRNEMSSILLRYRDERGDDWADIIDMLTLHPKARRHVARVLAEIGPLNNVWGGRATRANGEDSPAVCVPP
jgi:hypothetical protein